MPDASIIRLTRRNLLMLAEKAIGSNLFRNFYVIKLPNSEPFDVVEDGNLSCAVFISTLLVMVGLVQRPHFVVANVLRDMEASGWRQLEAPLPGAVIVWNDRGDGHPHIGLVVDETTCIYNSSSAGTPQRASFVLDGRQPDAFYWHNALEDPAGL